MNMTAATVRVHRAAPAPPRRRRPAIAAWSAGYIVLSAAAAAAAVSGLLDFRVVLTALNVAAFVAAIVGLRRPAIGLLGIAMLCALDPLVGPLLLNGGLWRWNTLNYWLLVVMFLWAPFLIRVSDVHSRLLQALVVLLTLEILLSADPARGMQDVLDVVTSFGVLVYIYRAGVDGETWFWVALTCGVLGTCASAGFLSQMLQFPSINPNNWSHVPLTSVLVVCLGFPLCEKFPRRQALLGVLAVVNTAWVFLSTSRGSLLIALVSLTFLVLLAPRLRRSVVHFALGGLVCVLILSEFASLRSTTMKRVRLLFNPEESMRDRTSGRFDLALGGWYIFREHPLGIGTGGFSVAWAQLGPREGLSKFHLGQATPAHSGWVKVLSENGIPGLVLLIMYVVSFSVAGRRTGVRRLRLLGYLVTASFTFGLVPVELSHKDLLFLAQGASMFLHRPLAPDRRLRA
jgi:O-antigen ligase